MSILSLLPRACVQVSRTVVEHLIVRPLQGLQDVINGILQAAPDLYRAASDAIVDAVESRLSATARHNVRQGVDRVLAGAKLLAVPAGVAAAVLVFLHPSILWAAWLLVLATSVAV